MKISINKTFNIENFGTVIIPILKNDTLNGALETIGTTFDIVVERLKTDFKGDFKEMTYFYKGQTRIYLLGLGEKPNNNDVLLAFRNLSFSQKSKFNGGQIALDFIHANFDQIAFLKSAVNGTLLGSYRVGLYKSENNSQHPLSKEGSELTVFLENSVENAEIIANQAVMSAETQIQIMDLVKAAPKYKTPQYLAEWAINSGKKYDYSVVAFDKKECIVKGLKALMSVNAGSEQEPRFIIMEYKHPNAKKKVGLIGKGVTFDTGGISIKPSNNMYLMKSDMGGAAAVFGTMELVAKLKLPVHLIGIVPATENMVDGAGTRPGDVIDSYSGKTIEVIDTDAEGRLILADGLAYMKKQYNPDVMIDLATLTGNVVTSLGYNAAGLFSNNDELATALAKAGEVTGERLWRMPMWEVYFEDMKSDVADIANLSSKPVAGAITAAKFLEFFIDNHTSWAHLDIAAMAIAASELGTHRNATAYGIRLLTEYVDSVSRYS